MDGDSGVKKGASTLGRDAYYIEGTHDRCLDTRQLLRKLYCQDAFSGLEIHKSNPLLSPGWPDDCVYLTAKSVRFNYNKFGDTHVRVYTDCGAGKGIGGTDIGKVRYIKSVGGFPLIRHFIAISLHYHVHVRRSNARYSTPENTHFQNVKITGLRTNTAPRTGASDFRISNTSVGGTVVSSLKFISKQFTENDVDMIIDYLDDLKTSGTLTKGPVLIFNRNSKQQENKQLKTYDVPDDSLEDVKKNLELKQIEKDLQDILAATPRPVSDDSDSDSTIDLTNDELISDF